jgi:hypothetical protein
MFDLSYEKTNGGYLVSGQTFHCKDDIKAYGGKWHPESKTWFVQDVDGLKTHLSMLKTLNNMQLERFKQKRKIEIKLFSST